MHGFRAWKDAANFLTLSTNLPIPLYMWVARGDSKRMMVAVLVFVALFIFFLQLACYALLIPDPSQKPLRITSFDIYVGRIGYITAYLLSLLRAPLGLVPYLVKMFIFFVLKIRYESAESTYFR